MMNAAIVDVMTQTGHAVPDAHNDAALMAALAADVSELTGFENLGLPFCMTVEAEALGSKIDYGSLKCEPKVAQEAFPGVESIERKPAGTIERSARAAIVLNAAASLARNYPDKPVIGSVTGPISAAASIVDPMTFLKQLRKNPAAVHAALEYVTAHIIGYTNALIDSGASVISIADPTATGEILGPKMFEAFAVPYITRLINAAHARSTPVILHICGDVSRIEPQLAALPCDALSVDAMVPLVKLKPSLSCAAMGNVSTYLLEFGEPDAVSRATDRLRADGIDILSPACGLSTSTPLSNIRALTDTVKQSA
jgi:[methyl-Co(III) methanol-specific corrinoid protein]:coenzyme M methyltransferase